jgi:recombination protein RecA
VTNRVITRSGAWFKYGDAYLGQGKEKARQHLLENGALTAELREKILAAVGYYDEAGPRSVAASSSEEFAETATETDS